MPKKLPEITFHQCRFSKSGKLGFKKAKNPKKYLFFMV
jgi:hypothetical protein